MTKPYKAGDTVEWKWADATASGKVQECYTQKITKTIKDTEVTRNADDQCPAYLIQQSDGGKVLKSHSEITQQS